MQLRNGDSETFGTAQMTDPKKRQDTQAISLQNASSPLLKLPPEIKDHIFNDICGHNTIHIDRESGMTEYKLSHHQCQTDISENDAQNVFDTCAATWFARGVFDRHAKCDEQAYAMEYPSSKHLRTVWESNIKLDFQFLGTCRQFYNDIKHVPYKNNAFAFNSFLSLDRFIETSPLCAVVRGIMIDIPHLQMSMGNNEWSRVLKSIPNTMPSLQRAHLSINHNFPVDPYKSLLNKCDPLMPAILSLAKLQLKTATFVLYDHTQVDKDLSRWMSTVKFRYVWTMEETRDWIKGVRMKLLREEPPTGFLERIDGWEAAEEIEMHLIEDGGECGTNESMDGMASD